MFHRNAIVDFAASGLAVSITAAFAPAIARSRMVKRITDNFNLRDFGNSTLN
jgi:hypothetical protein